MKHCKKCDQDKKLIEFGKDKNTNDGLNFYCKECIKKRSAKQRKENLIYYKDYAKSYGKENKEKISEYHRIRREKNREICLEQSKKSYYKYREEIALKRKAKRETFEGREKERKRQEKYRLKDPEKYRKYIDTWRRKNLEKPAAHQRVHRAVKEGILKRLEKCEKCEMKCKTEGHHEDYSKPLNVIWLCKLCHGKTRNKL